MIKAEDIECINGNVLIEVLDQEENSILLPENFKKEQPKFGRVLSVADEYISPQGNSIKIFVKVGDYVLYGGFAGDELELNGKEYRLVEALYIKTIVKNYKPVA